MTTPTVEQFAVTPLESVEMGLQLLLAGLDAAHADGYAIPPLTAHGVASLQLSLTILKGQDAERTQAGPDVAAASMADAERLRTSIAPDAPRIILPNGAHA